MLHELASIGPTVLAVFVNAVIASENRSSRISTLSRCAQVASPRVQP